MVAEGVVVDAAGGRLFGGRPPAPPRDDRLDVAGDEGPDFDERLGPEKVGVGDHPHSFRARRVARRGRFGRFGVVIIVPRPWQPVQVRGRVWGIVPY
jgi:hypothetical protein